MWYRSRRSSHNLADAAQAGPFETETFNDDSSWDDNSGSLGRTYSELFLSKATDKLTAYPYSDWEVLKDRAFQVEERYQVELEARHIDWRVTNQGYVFMCLVYYLATWFKSSLVSHPKYVFSSEFSLDWLLWTRDSLEEADQSKPSIEHMQFGRTRSEIVFTLSFTSALTVFVFF